MDQIMPTLGIPESHPQVVNPLLQRVRIPGETFTLPSGGVFYTNGELAPDIENGEVHVYPMTGIDELIMKSVDKIINGEAVKEVFARCIPGVVKPGELSAKDVDYLLVALKKVSYGPTFDVNYTHDCEDAEQHTYELPLDMFLRGAKTVNPTTVRTAFQYRLENGQVVHFKPASYDDVVKVFQLQQIDDASEEEPSQTEVLHRLLMSVTILIDKVDETSDRDMIVQWMKTLPVSWLQSISDAAVATTQWGVEFNVPIKCIDCGAELVIPTPLNPISFFI
jgi:hypothetical protein